ncbi:hypothetical protein AQUCO_00600130v1 [Aquilegia coerulea]|uniref:Uncharacterized protein n=1 Tax=Aquilegia coerulea TaxID=218851 RepID=A0A2G5ENB6_AQUCA|nr:hypothetical protein AQUCO_00600130v1 [Aquilegia coerulea]
MPAELWYHSMGKSQLLAFLGIPHVPQSTTLEDFGYSYKLKLLDIRQVSIIMLIHLTTFEDDLSILRSHSSFNS